MMSRKFLLIFIIGLCVFPARAQWRTLSGWTAWNGLRKSAASAPRVAENVERGVTRALVKVQPPMATHIQIRTTQGLVFVKLGTPLPVTGGMPGNPFPVLKARAMSGQANYQALFKRRDYSVYLPIALNTSEECAYRGLRLYSLDAIHRILTSGLQYSKVSSEMDYRMYFSGSLYRVTNYNYINQWDSRQAELPTIVKFAVPSYHGNIYARNDWDYYYYFRDLPAGFIQDVMVFLEVGGEPGWYKVTLENGELVFTPAPSRVFKFSELVDHKIDIPEINMNPLW